jgi:hypothetical protein
MGNSWIWFSATTWLISVRVGSIRGTSADTLTTSVAVWMTSLMSRVAVWPTVSRMPGWLYLAKPAASAERS